eukprot:754022-Hanusia_phi.AAC.2
MEGDRREHDREDQKMSDVWAEQLDEEDDERLHVVEGVRQQKLIHPISVLMSGQERGDGNQERCKRNSRGEEREEGGRRGGRDRSWRCETHGLRLRKDEWRDGDLRVRCRGGGRDEQGTRVEQPCRSFHAEGGGNKKKKLRCWAPRAGGG